MAKQYRNKATGEIYEGVFYDGSTAAVKQLNAMFGHYTYAEYTGGRDYKYQGPDNFKLVTYDYKGYTLELTKHGYVVKQDNPGDGATIEYIYTETAFNAEYEPIRDDLPGEAPKLPADRRKKSGGTSTSKSMTTSIGKGQCSLCGRPLRDAKSVARGMGPVCYEKSTAGEQQGFDI